MRLKVFSLLASTIFVGGAAVGFCVFSLGVSLVAENSKDLPPYAQLATYAPQTGSTLLAADGSLLARHADQRRTYVPLDQIPPAVIQAFLSAEDKNYWTHHGIDVPAIMRAGITNIRTGTMIGGSSITQQVAKNLIVGDEDSVTRKIKEAVLAMRMDTEIGKNRILEIYLNEFYLGAGAYGVAAAADAYFSKTLDQLTIDEIAMLAGMPKAPSAYDPRNNPTRAKERRDYVLRRMAEDGVIKPEDAERAIARPIVLNLNMNRASDVEVEGNWFATDAWTAIKSKVVDSGIKGDVVVKTTLIPQVQEAANAALAAGIMSEDRRLGWRGPLGTTTLPIDWTAPAVQPPPGSERFILGVVSAIDASATVETKTGQIVLDAAGVEWAGKRMRDVLKVGDVILVDMSTGKPVLAQMPAVEGALVVLDPRSGNVLALVGGFSHARSEFDRATQAKRQPGSAFKPIVYLTALELGYDATSPLLDASITLEQGPGQEDWRPSDAKGAGKGGLITLRRALELSRNMASVRLLWDIGLPDVANMMDRLGVEQPGQMSYAIGLGAGEVTPIQLALAYGTIANGGYALKPRFVDSLETKEGQILEVPPQGIGEQVVDPIAAAQMASILQGVVTDGTAKTAFDGFDRPFAGKTGTTNSARDAWFVGIAGDVVVAAWIGRDDNQPLKDGASGGRTAASIVRDFLDRAGDAFQLLPTPVPATGIQTMFADPETGLQAAGGHPEIVREGWYVVNAPAAPQDDGSSAVQVLEDAFTTELPAAPGYTQ